ncbi:MAG: SH3 domain-containing protein [Lachnospiraceae bacterium]|nr:SH3 domain-containing protein [Candidatus Merdinaster equi]
MNKNTQTAILFGATVLLAILVVVFSIKLRLDDSPKQSVEDVMQQVAQENKELEEQQEAEITPAEPVIETEIITMVRTTDTVNVRSGPDTKYGKLGEPVPKGSEFKLLEAEDNGWSRIEYNGQEAYIKSDYLKQFEVEVEVVREPSNEEGESGTQDGNGDYDSEVDIDNMGSEDVIVEQNEL